MCIEKSMKSLIKLFSSFQDISLLFVRLILAYGFYGPAMKKLSNFSGVVQWFSEGLHLPFPYINAIMAVGTEVSGVVLLTLGLMTRFISIPMMVVMIVAISTVHWVNGFPASNNGYEIPLYYLIMLFLLCTTGPGKISLDELVLKKISK